MDFVKKEVGDIRYNIKRKIRGESGSDASIGTSFNRFGSFSPVRRHGIVKWYVDGKDYLYAVSEAIEFAKEAIYIEDWWLSPEIVCSLMLYFFASLSHTRAAGD